MTTVNPSLHVYGSASTPTAQQSYPPLPSGLAHFEGSHARGGGVEVVVVPLPMFGELGLVFGELGALGLAVGLARTALLLCVHSRQEAGQAVPGSGSEGLQR